ncbi:MAG: hypothetical protein H6983_14275 [Ectothiorhodospiraceae bacterium]|nr:hypothetical protein [Chromatiales bacterium]MCP5155332.1 hypothetical protein [Ectothiorhodospiraceae bacterium]
MRLATKLMAGVALATVVVAAGAQQRDRDPVLRVIPRGQDGPDAYYQVRCRNESTGMVVLRDDRGEACAQPRGRDEVCNRDWNLQTAAEAACR